MCWNKCEIMSDVSERATYPGDGSRKDILGRSYQHPPVVEALCELFFEESSWNDSLPEAFFESVKDVFPKRQIKDRQEVKVTMEEDVASAGVHKLTPVIQFVSDQSDQIIQVAENLLVVNQLRPYRHFEEWEGLIYEGLSIYNELASPKKITNIGVRYINLFEIPGPRFPMESYFNVFPNLPESLGDVHGSFSIKVDIPQPDQGHSVLITLATTTVETPTPGSQAFILDLHDRTAPDFGPREIDLVRDTVRIAHNNVVKAFEDSITDHLRELFEREQAK